MGSVWSRGAENSDGLSFQSIAGLDSSTSSDPWWKGLKRTELPNPGTYENFSDEASQILRPLLFEGVQFNVTLPLSPIFSVGHMLEMGSAGKLPMYAFSANYLTNHLAMISRVDLTGRVHGRVFYSHTPSLTSKLQAEAGFEPHSSRFTYDLDHRGSDSSTQLKVGSGGIAAISYLQSITPRISLGGEVFYQGKNRFSGLTLAMKYASPTEIATVMASSFGPVIASYVRKVNSKVSLACELFWDSRSGDSLTTLGYRFDLRCVVHFSSILGY